MDMCQSLHVKAIGFQVTAPTLRYIIVHNRKRRPNPAVFGTRATDLRPKLYACNPQGDVSADSIDAKVMDHIIIIW